MKKKDVIAEVILRDLKKRERLIKIIHNSGFEYYTRGSILGFASILLFVVLLTWFLLRENVPIWGFMVCFVALISLMEATRQRYRFDALLELKEQEKQKANPKDNSSSER